MAHPYNLSQPSRVGSAIFRMQVAEGCDGFRLKSNRMEESNNMYKTDNKKEQEKQSDMIKESGVIKEIGNQEKLDGVKNKLKKIQIN